MAVLPDALGTGPPGAFDDLATWTGSVVHHDGRWHLLYTGAARAEAGGVQRVGLASSHDLVTWERHGLGARPTPPGTGRWSGDPWVVWDDDTQRFHMLVTAAADPRTRAASSATRGRATCARGRPGRRSSGRASSASSRCPSSCTWRRLAHPVLGDAGRPRRRAPAPDRRRTVRHALPGSAEKFGAYTLDGDDFLVGDEAGRFYAGRLLRRRRGWAFLAWRLRDERGRFVGELSDPMPVTVAADGALSVDVPAELVP